MADKVVTEDTVPTRVTVVNMNMRFGTMVFFMVKLAIGSGIGGLAGRV